MPGSFFRRPVHVQEASPEAFQKLLANGIGFHDTIWILAAAMQAAGTTTDVAKISAAMRTVKSYKRSTLDLQFNDKGIANHPQQVGVLDGASGKVSFKVPDS